MAQLPKGQLQIWRLLALVQLAAVFSLHSLSYHVQFSIACFICYHCTQTISISHLQYVTQYPIYIYQYPTLYVNLCVPNTLYPISIITYNVLNHDMSTIHTQLQDKQETTNVWPASSHKKEQAIPSSDFLDVHDIPPSILPFESSHHCNQWFKISLPIH